MSRVFRPTRPFYVSVFSSCSFAPLFRSSSVFTRSVYLHKKSRNTRYKPRNEFAVQFMTATDFYFPLLLRLKASPLSLDDKSDLVCSKLCRISFGYQLPFSLEKLRVRHTSQMFFNKCIDRFKNLSIRTFK